MTATLVVLVNKSFAMIYETADNVMKWIGGGNSGAGEVQGAMQGAVGGAKGAVGQIASALTTKPAPGGAPGPGTTATNGKAQSTDNVPVSIQDGSGKKLDPLPNDW